jgi:hypothetical protein
MRILALSSRCRAAAIGLAALSAPALSQDYDSGAAMDMTGMSIYSQEAAMMDAAGQADRVVRSRASNPTPTISFDYRNSSARTRANLAKFAQKSRSKDPVGAAKMAELFASTDVIGLIDQKMQQAYGMRANNVADAYAMWWVSAWMGAQGRSDDASAGQMAMVKRQASNALGATREFASSSDAGKQELAEALLVQAALIQATIDTYKSDPAMLAKTRASIKQGAKAMGLDLGTMTLTDEGFKPARKTGVVETLDETQLAANGGAESQPAPTTDKSPPYLLLAAAGGAGLGGAFLVGKAMARRG